MQEKKTCECRIPDSPHMRAVGLLIRNMRRHHALVERRTCDLGIHHSQHRMLIALAKRQDNVPSQKELAEILGISAAAVTATLKKLEKEGYITRSMTDEDNRKNEIRITDMGISKLMEGRAIFESSDRTMFEGFSPEEMAMLISFMERIGRNLDDAGVPTDPPRTEHSHKPPIPPAKERKCDLDRFKYQAPSQSPRPSQMVQIRKALPALVHHRPPLHDRGGHR